MHLKSFILLLAITFSQYSGYSQTTKYDSVFVETAQVLLNSNPKKALSNTTYLYKISNNNSERIKACMLKATLLRQYGLRNDAISELKRADSIATTDKNFIFLARVNGFISTIYRENEIYSLGKIHLQKALAVSKKIADKNEMYKFQGILSQEIAYYEMYDKQYSKAISHLKSVNQLFDKVGSGFDKNFQWAVNDELIAKNYLALKKVDSAMLYYQKALTELSSSSYANGPLKGFIYNGFANVYNSTGDYKKALEYYNKAEQIANESNFFALKQEVYNSLMEFYKKTNSKKYILYNEKNLELNKDDEHNRKIIADDLIKSLRNKQVQNKSHYTKTIYIVISICVFIILLTLGYYLYKRKQDRIKFKNYISNIKAIPEIKIVPEPKKEIAKDYMSEATENSILKSLQEFEQTQFYLNKDLSLNSVAAEININHRYLSYVINKHKSKDFAGYINELRINYIVDRLRNDPSYLKYKISYLADKAGFSSHSRFTITFKKITGVSPLDFITYLQKENSKISE